HGMAFLPSEFSLQSQLLKTHLLHDIPKCLVRMNDSSDQTLTVGQVDLESGVTYYS
ncbi:hypothetical protein P7K49_028079, partial [Saguinus oedipus]